jgi:CubicO group peptidase (beta-lactamase class C family)
MHSFTTFLRSTIFFPVIFLCLTSAPVNGVELNPPQATQAELAKASYSEEKNLADLAAAFFDTSPEPTGDGLATGTLGKDGGAVEPVLAFANEIAAGTHGEVDSLLISYHGKLLFESYYRRGRINYPHYQMSITKSYTALAIGRAIQCGFITMDDLERPVCDFLEELDPSQFVEGAAVITLADVMTMRSGIRIPQAAFRQLRSDTENSALQRQVQFFFERTSPIAPAPRDYKYQGTDPAITMQVLAAVVPGSARDFLEKELLQKLHIKRYEWSNDISGLPKSAAGSSMCSRDMMKWGHLVLYKGRLNGKQIVPAEFIERATSPLCAPSDTNSYGFFFWQHDAMVANTETRCITCRGAGGQFIFMFPQYDVVAVVTSHNKGMGPLLKTLPGRLLPYFREDS